MAYYIGTQEFATIGEATDFMRRNPDVAEEGLRITSEPVGNEGMLTGGVKGEPTKQAPIVPDETPSATTPQTFTLIEGREKGDRDFQTYLYGQEGEVQQVTVDELRNYFESDDVNRLREMFGTFDNYLAYMTEREQLLQSGDLTVGNWSEADAGLTEDQEMILEGDADLTIDPSDPGQNLENLIGQQRGAQVAGYQNWLNSEANQELLQKYGVQSTVYSGSGDKFQWNGSAYVKVEEVSNPGVTDFVKSGILAAMTYYMGAGLTDFLSSSTLTTASGQTIAGPGLSSSLATGASSGISNAAMQLVATGNVDFGEALESAITAGLGAEALRQIQQSGVLDQLVETVGQYTERQDWISLEDGTLFKLVNEYDANGNLIDSLSRVLMPNGGTLSLENFLQFASEGNFGSPVLFDAVGLPVFFFREGLQTPEFIDRLIQAASDAYSQEGGSAFNRIVNFLSGGSSSGGGSSSYEAVLTGDLNSTSNNATLLNMLRGALENTTDPETRADLERQIEAYEREVEEDEEVDVNEDDTVEDADSVLVDTTADNAPGITEEMFQDVVDQVRADNQVETQEIIDAINALGVADLPTLAQIQEAFPELNDVSLEQINDTVSTLLSEAGLLTAEQFTEAMANVLTPEQLATALADLPYGDAEDFAEAISNAGLATPEDITTALTDANLATSEDIAGLARAFVQSGFATPTDVVTALSESGLATPEDIATALSESGLATLEQIITAFTDSGLATSEDIAGLARAFTQSGFATPQDLADAFEAAGLATPQDVIDAISAAGLATPQDVADALEAFGFTDAQLEQITGALPEGLTTDQLNTALSDALAGIATGTDLDTATTTITDAIGALGFATPQDVRDALSEFGFTEAQLQQIVGALPEGLSVSDLDTALEGVVVGADLDTAVTTITDAISGLDIASAQDVRDALSEFNFSEDQLNQIINALPESLSASDLATALENVVVGTDLDTAVTDITTAISGLDIASPDDVREILAEYGFTAEQLEQIAGSITIPESATVAEIQNIVNAIPAGLTAEEVATQLSSQFEGLTTGIAGVQGGIDQLAEDLGLSTEGLLTAIENLGTTSGEDLTELQTNILEGLGLLSQDLGVDIGDVVTSVTDLEVGLTENITGLSDQLTGVEEAVGGVTTAVNRGIEDLADALGVQTDDITSAIVTLGSGLGGELTELETSVLSGLSSLADSLGTDVGTVVDSIGGLGTDISANIQGLSDTLGEQLGAGFGGLGEQLGAGFGQLGQQLGLATLGLFGLGAKQPTAQQIAAAQDKFEFKPFEEQMKPRQVQQVVQARPVQQQPSALQQINKFIDRQSNIPRPANQGMFTGDPNRKLA